MLTKLAFYHWQTELSIDSLEQSWLDHSQSERLYVKFFDVDWDYNQQEAIPHAELLLGELPDSIRIIPTIFITNRCFQQIRAAESESLAAAILAKIQELWPGLSAEEIQIDCDWTATSREAYFRFLRKLKALLPASTALSATIRLHQYRYPQQTGVPPVDRGMLMYYNMGDLTNWTETNSILNLDKAAPYLEANDYPLVLDLALPLFHWGVLFREGHMIKLMNGLDATDLSDKSFKKIASNDDLGSSHWLVTESTYLDGYYLYAGDQIRLEYITMNLLEQTDVQLQQVSPKGDRYLSFYHLDGEILKKWDALRLLGIFD